MSINVCEIIAADAQNVARACDILASGGLVAFPTETVYGLGADAESDAAVEAIYRAKGRPAHNPLIVHLADATLLSRYAEVNGMAAELAQIFWPGPLTLVLPRKADGKASTRVSAGGNTIALRVPRHPVAHALLTQFGRGIAAPSANRSGRISPTSAVHVQEEFAGAEHPPAVILEGGDTEVGIESTVVDCTGTRPVILRAGTITAEQIAAIVSLATESALGDETLRSPGMLASHYAPQTPVRLNATHIEPDEALLAFGTTTLHAPTMRNLSPTASLEEAAHNLYAYLRSLDAAQCKRIAVMPIPQRGVGVAINDRLGRAAAPH